MRSFDEFVYPFGQNNAGMPDTSIRAAFVSVVVGTLCNLICNFAKAQSPSLGTEQVLQVPTDIRGASIEGVLIYAKSIQLLFFLSNRAGEEKGV
ncbi:MAG: hypothetical protein ACD_36C00085G0007 [uncultured bacterium]|uniref:Uncharacterized protein n=1 Tax=Candidatus Gottesmanbacteria bacterium RIFCSPLOWO2_01_FULL_43_11b TaxID=1798392 RepID=A0A1F6AGS9_9BACT|nr:MAG: hypothetical protein ACD_36C00085G0007 [uncultured bacterium]OGG23959.1 MAG: hypothetical protein A3A79_02030 [Candidatus Gottesmanbacteria bacterium RIFCSPLOWO2_01_FULL_43_11b]